MSLLPREVWELIFEHVQAQNKWTSATDLTNCTKTCVTFQDILQPNQCTWQFKAILPIIFPKLNRSSILTLRLVCKSWKLTVDHFLQNYQYYLDIVSQNRHENPKSLQRSVTGEVHPLGDLAFLSIFRDGGNLKRFLDQDNLPQNVNPFPGGSLSFQLCEVWGLHPSNPREYWQDWPLVLQLLSKYGQHVIHLDIQLKHLYTVSVDFLTQLVSCLHFIPNLKTLYIRLQVRWDIEELRRGAIDIDDLLPPLPNLEILQFSHNIFPWWSTVPSYFQNALASRYLNQLSRLQFSLHDDFCPSYLQPPIPYKAIVLLSHFKELELHVTSVAHLKVLQTLSTSNAQLKKVTLLITCKLPNYRKDFTIFAILKILIPFARSLQSLCLIYCDFPQGFREELHIIRDSAKELQLLQKMGSLKNLQLYGLMFLKDQGIFSVLPSSLEYLHLLVHRSKKGLPKELNGDIDKRYRNVIWGKLKNLKCVSVRGIFDEIYEEYTLDMEELQTVPFSKSKMYWRSTWEWRQMERNNKKRRKKQNRQFNKCHRAGNRVHKSCCNVM